MSLQFFSGKSPKYSNIPNGNIVIGQAANTGDKIDLSLAKYCTNEFKQDMPKFYYLKNGDILLNTLGNGTLGRTGIFNLERQDILTDGHLFIFRMLFLITSYYLYYYLKNNRTMIEKSANGTTNQVFLNSSMVGSYLIPLPPLAEQERIINKINLFQPLLEQYDKLEKQLTKLENEITGKLKKSILQYAIQGKLVKQDPNDEPASVLLERIKAEKEKLIKEGKIKRDKNESFIYQGDDKNYYEKIGKNEPVDITDDLPFDIPDSWEWIRLKNTSILNGGYAFKSEKFSSSGIRVIRISDFNEFGIVNKEIKRYPISKEIEQYKIELGDILICMTGGTVGKSLLVEILNEDSFINQRIALVRPFILNNYYLNVFIKSPYLLKLISSSKTSTNDNISMKAIEDFLIPLPPLEEQKRIIEKIEEL